MHHVNSDAPQRPSESQVSRSMGKYTLLFKYRKFAMNTNPIVSFCHSLHGESIFIFIKYNVHFVTLKLVTVMNPDTSANAKRETEEVYLCPACKQDLKL